MPRHRNGTQKGRSCSSHGGTRKQRGGLLAAFKKAASSLQKKAASLNKTVNARIINHVQKNPNLAKHAAIVNGHLNTAKNNIAAMSRATTKAAHSAAARAAKNALYNAIRVYERFFPNDEKTLNAMLRLLEHPALHPNQEPAPHIDSHLQGGRKKHGHKKRAHKKRHATKKRAHKKRHATKKHGHKKRHATKKRGHKKRKQRGGKCGCEML